ncbi:hypothetical protein [Isoptericola croceus]|nr:hypothetical protein [Isoptericola croceus]
MGRRHEERAGGDLPDRSLLPAPCSMLENVLTTGVDAVGPPPWAVAP